MNRRSRRKEERAARRAARVGETAQRLAEAMGAAGAPSWMVIKARSGHYGDYTSTLAFPITQLVADLEAAGLGALADRARAGDFDATKAESDAWAASPEGKATMREVTEPEEGGTIRVTTECADDGYALTVSYGEDVSAGMDPARAWAYVGAVTRAAMTARHDAAVLKHLGVRLKMPIDLALSVIHDLRAHREPLDAAATAPVTLAPIISAVDRLGYVQVHLHDAPYVQLTPDEASTHAAQVLQALCCADLDRAYMIYMRDDIGLGEDKARALIHDLAADMNGD